MTFAPTRLHGSDARNVMPARATVDVDCRLLPGETRADLERELRARARRRPARTSSRTPSR